MSKHPSDHVLLANYVKQARWIGGFTLLIAVLAIVVATVGLDSGWLQTVVLAVSAAAVPGGLALLVFDPLLREDAAQDIFAALEVNKSITSWGLTSVGDTQNKELARVLSHARTLQVFPLDIRSWRDAEFAAVVEQAHGDELQVEIFISAPEEEYASVLATRANEAVHVWMDILRETPAWLVGAWDKANPHPKSKLLVYYVTGFPNYGCMVAGTLAEIEFGPTTIHHQPKRRAVRFTFEKGHDGYDFVHNEVSGNQYADPPTLAETRPLHPVETLQDLTTEDHQ